jgi:hypothetical protein
MVVYGAATAVLTLAVPLTVDALISSIMFGTMLTPLVVLVGVLLGCLVLQGILRGMQIFVAEVIERRIFVRVTSDLSWRLPRIDISAFDNSYGPELVNRFFDTVTVQKSSSKLCLSLTDIVLSTLVGMTVLSFYHPFLLILALTLIAAIFVLVFVFGIGGVRTAVQMSIAKFETAAWSQELARHTTAFCTKGGATFAADRADAAKHGRCESFDARDEPVVEAHDAILQQIKRAGDRREHRADDKGDRYGAVHVDAQKRSHFAVLLNGALGPSERGLLHHVPEDGEENRGGDHDDDLPRGDGHGVSRARLSVQVEHMLQNWRHGLVARALRHLHEVHQEDGHADGRDQRGEPK